MNTNAKHTPGPWTVIDAIKTKERYHIATDLRAPGASMIAHIHGNEPKSGSREANARLIAKAPDMFSAIQDIISSAQANDANSLAEAISHAERVINV